MTLWGTLLTVTVIFYISTSKADWGWGVHWISTSIKILASHDHKNKAIKVKRLLCCMPWRVCKRCMCVPEWHRHQVEPQVRLGFHWKHVHPRMDVVDVHSSTPTGYIFGGQHGAAPPDSWRCKLGEFPP